MASISRSRRLPEPRSGGKIVRPRRAAASKTPYDRPTPSNSTSQSPSWLSRFVFSPTRSIASGAGKLLSTVFDLESSPTSSTSSSSSSSSSANDSTAEEEIGIANDENGASLKGDDMLNKSGTLEVINTSGKDLQPVVWNSKNKRVIEQLIMRETFSREESDRFIRIIRSRVVDASANEDEWNQRPSDMLNRTLANDSPDLSSAAVMEAKKWLEEQKSRLDSNSDLGYGSHNLDTVTLPQALKDEGSPVDVAKSYMRSLPPWSSPSRDHSKPLTPIGIQLLKEETPVSGYSPSSTKLKRDSPATGSWSIQDEIRRVRSRATEQMLSSLPSSKIDWSAFAVECKDNVNPSATENIEATVVEKVPNFTNSMDASVNLVNEYNTHSAPDLERKQDGVQLESAQSDSANINSEQNQGSQANFQQTEGSQDDCREITISGHKLRSSDDVITNRDGGMVKVNGISDMNGANCEIDSAKETREASESVLHDESYSVLKEKVGADVSANGFPSSGPSNAGQGTEQNDKTLDNKHDTVGSGDERISKGVAEQETCEPVSGTCMEVADMTANNNMANEDDGVATGSQNSSSVQNDFELEHSEVAPEPDVAVSTRSIAEKQKGKRISRYNRRGRGRGRGRVGK